MQAVKKPITINFLPYTLYPQEIMDWVISFGDKFHEHFDTVDGLKVKTLEGTSYDVTEEDVIIRGIKGEYYPCKKDVFENSYDILK